MHTCGAQVFWERHPGNGSLQMGPSAPAQMSALLKHQGPVAQANAPGLPRPVLGPPPAHQHSCLHGSASRRHLAWDRWLPVPAPPKHQPPLPCFPSGFPPSTLPPHSSQRDLGREKIRPCFSAAQIPSMAPTTCMLKFFTRVSPCLCNLTPLMSHRPCSFLNTQVLYPIRAFAFAALTPPEMLLAWFWALPAPTHPLGLS